jgi:hypothetical protein
MWSMARTAVAGFTATTLAACGGSPETTTLTTTTSAPTTTTAVAAAPTPAQPRSVRWVDLSPGDCLADPPPSDPAVVMVNVVDCADPHRAEAYLRAPLPVNAALADIADKDCAAGLTRYTAATPGSATYTITYLIDSDQDRTSNNPFPSTAICLLQGADGRSLTGSARR